MNKTSRKNRFRMIIKPLFIVYLCVLVFVVIMKFPTRLALDAFLKWVHKEPITRLEPQLVPFRTIKFYYMNVKSLHDWFFQNLLCNIIIFIPYGLLLPFLLEDKKNIFRKTILSGIIVILCIEIFQYASALGHLDIDDLIMNTISILIGYGLYILTKRLWKKIEEK